MRKRKFRRIVKNYFRNHSYIKPTFYKYGCRCEFKIKKFNYGFFELMYIYNRKLWKLYFWAKGAYCTVSKESETIEGALDWLWE